MNVKICAFTGHRPASIPALPGLHAAVEAALEAAVRQAVSEGFTLFRSGGAMGVDLWCAQAVVKLQRKCPHIRLHFLLPCETQADHWPECWRERYFDLLAKADEVMYLQGRYSEGCMQRRNRALVNGAHLLMAYYNGGAKGGAAYTVRYAREKGVPVRNLFPVEATCLE